MQVSLKGIAISTFFLAKQIESANKSSKRNSKAMTWLTVVLVFCTVAQVIIAVIKR